MKNVEMIVLFSKELIAMFNLLDLFQISKANLKELLTNLVVRICTSLLIKNVVSIVMFN